MKPAPFDYAAPETLEEAIGLLREHGDDAKVIAGGQSLVPLLAFRLAAPALLVDVNRVDGLSDLRLDDGTLTAGALVRHRDVETLTGLRERCAMLADGVALIGHVAIRNRGTVGGSIAHADPAAEWPSLLLALDGEVDVRGPEGPRTVPGSELFDTYFTTTLRPDELLTEVRLRLPPGRVGSAYLELARRHGDFAIAGAGAVLGLDDGGRVSDARVVLIGVRDTAVRSSGAEAVLRGAEPGEGLFAEAAEAIDGEIDPVTDLHGSSDYRRKVAKVLVRRALSRALERVPGGA
ncbi:MAG TPA: xanthine dehydrogenase family protein subunit M [Actinomycetota bacterium]